MSFLGIIIGCAVLGFVHGILTGIAVLCITMGFFFGLQTAFTNTFKHLHEIRRVLNLK